MNTRVVTTAAGVLAFSRAVFMALGKFSPGYKHYHERGRHRCSMAWQHWRLLIVCLGFVAGWLASPVFAAEVINVRLGRAPDHTRIVFDLSAPADHKLVQLSNPDRIVLDIADTRLQATLDAVELENTPVTGLHSSIRGNNDLRIVLDMATAVTPRSFALKANGQRGDRLVLDLYDRKRQVNTPTAQERAPEVVRPDAPSWEGAKGTWSGYISFDTRLFPDDPSYPDQDEQNASVALEPEYYVDWDDGEQRIVFHPFFRYDVNDDERTHGDLREFYWRKTSGDIELKLGVGRVFWGVTESQHLVDIINQTDLVENIDFEDKLGQPMLNLSVNKSWGTLALFVLPYFRERTFPGSDGRLRPQPAVDTDNPIYESGDEEKHVDYAVRWSHYIGDWDIGVAHFSGTAREPLLLPAASAGEVTLRPFYQQIDQTRLDMQAT